MSISLVIVFFEVQFLEQWLTVWVEQPWYHTIPRTLLLLTLSTFAIMITKQTYSRLCFTLFALVYVTQEKRDVELQKTA